MTTLGKKIEEMKEFTHGEIDFIVDAIDDLIKILNTVNFMHAFLALKAPQTNGDSMLEIYKKIMSGQDRDGITDHLLNFSLSGYKKSNGTVAITMMSTGKIMLNKYFLHKRMKKGIKGKAELINTLFHEYLHTLGYIHKHRWPIISRYKSMVYQAGNLVENIYLSEQNGVQLTKLITGGIV